MCSLRTVRKTCWFELDGLTGAAALLEVSNSTTAVDNTIYRTQTSHK